MHLHFRRKEKKDKGFSQTFICCITVFFLTGTPLGALFRSIFWGIILKGQKRLFSYPSDVLFLTFWHEWGGGGRGCQGQEDPSIKKEAFAQMSYVCSNTLTCVRIHYTRAWNNTWGKEARLKDMRLTQFLFFLGLFPDSLPGITLNLHGLSRPFSSQWEPLLIEGRREGRNCMILAKKESGLIANIEELWHDFAEKLTLRVRSSENCSRSSCFFSGLFFLGFFECQLASLIK